MNNETTVEYFNHKWTQIINKLPVGGQYRYDLRQYAYDIVKDNIKDNSVIFDYACGLGTIDLQLKQEKDCKVYGCDYSSVAIDYINKKLKTNNFKVTDKVFKSGKKYDVLLAVYFLEHIINPAEKVKEFLTYSKKVIAVIPNDFNRHGEHINMAWNSWDTFYNIFNDFRVKRLDIIDKKSKYPDNLTRAFKHPVVEFKK